MPHDLRERGHGADLEAAFALSDALELRDASKIDQRRGTPDAVLEPVEAVETSREHPGPRAVPIEQRLRVGDGGRLKQLERRHRISDDSHQTCALNGSCIRLPFSSDINTMSDVTGARRKMSSP